MLSDFSNKFKKQQNILAVYEKNNIVQNDESHGNLYICHFCGESFSNEIYDLHMVDCMEKNEKDQVMNTGCNDNYCNKCGKFISNNWILHKEQCKTDILNLKDNSNNLNILPTINRNQINNPDFNILSASASASDSNTDSKIYANSFSNSNVNLDKKNSFMLIHNTDSISNPNLISFDTQIPIIKSNQIIKEIKPIDFICNKCFRCFQNEVTLEIHKKNCKGYDDSSQWDNFDKIHKSEINPFNPFHQDQNLYNQIGVEHDDHDSYNSISEDDNVEPQHEQNNSNAEIDFTNPNLGYEDLLRLDDNIKHPISDFYLSMLFEEDLTSQIYANLNDETRQCMICFEEYEINQKFIRLPCLHFFHSAEIRHWFESNKTCPVCRMDIEDYFRKI